MAFVIHSKGSLGMPGLNEGRNRWNINFGSLSLSKLEPALDFQWDWLKNEREESKLLGILTNQMQFKVFKVRKLWEPFGTLCFVLMNVFFSFFDFFKQIELHLELFSF